MFEAPMLEDQPVADAACVAHPCTQPTSSSTDHDIVQECPSLPATPETAAAAAAAKCNDHPSKFSSQHLEPGLLMTFARQCSD